MIHEKTAHSGKKRPDLYETVLKEKEADMETEVLKEQHYVDNRSISSAADFRKRN